MNRCLQLALMGIGNVAPNPMVGCVLVHNNKIIGEGYHRKYGDAHAEVNAINDVKDKTLLSESILYVSLEPCNHFGKTPPCADLIIGSGIKKVVIGCTDPFEKVSGSGIKKLIANGVEVFESILSEECIELNRRFFTFHQKKRPYIILKWAQSEDGLISPVNQDENNRWISNSQSQKLVHKWRSEEQAILIGVNTALKDNPRLDVRSWQGQNPIRVLIDKNLTTPATHHLLSDGNKTVVFCQKKNEGVSVEQVQINFSDNVILQVLNNLYERKIQSVIVEGGSITLQHFIKDGIWDEARVFVAEDKHLKDGIAAPILAVKAVLEECIGNNKLLIYRNKSYEF